MNRKFVNRRGELEFLEERFKKSNFEFIVIYGRRRIGKSELIKEFIKDKESIYFLCDKRGTLSNTQRLKNKISDLLNEPTLETNELEDILEYLTKKTNRLVLVFDEFSYLVEKDPAIPSVFQVVVDEVLKNNNIFLILCGSSISMMKKGVLSHKSPLYGRKTGHIRLKGIPFKYFSDFFENNTKEENVEFYGVTDGVPFYMENLKDKKNLLENVKDEIASKRGRLFEEVDFLLQEELREPDSYKSILSAIADGNTRVVDIANNTKISANSLDRYLKVLMELDIIKRERRVTDLRGKKTIYLIDDNFFDFHFTFIEPFRSDLEIDRFDNLEEKFKRDFNSYMGRKFEKLSKLFFIRKFGSRFEKVGRWWGYWRDKKTGKRESIDIDIIGLNEKNKEIAFIEVKWSNFDKENELKRILKKTKKRAEYVKWNKGDRKEIFGIITKKIEGKLKEKLRNEGYIAYDLNDLAG